MTVETGSEAEAQNGADFTPRQIRILKVAVVVMGVILIGGFAVLLGTIFYQSTKLAGSGVGAGGGDPVAAFDVAIGRDRVVESITLDGNRVALHLSGPEGPEIAIVDLAKGKVVSRVRLKAE